MAIYFVSPNGADANNGLGADASHATNKPWLTLGKVFNTGSTVAPGDTVYFGPGTYLTSTLVPIASITSAATPTSFRGDPTNAQGFKTSGGVLLAPRVVRFDSGRTTAANEDTAGVSAVLFNTATNDPNGLQFFNLILEAGNSTFDIDTAGSTGLVCEDCVIITNAGYCISVLAGIPTAGRNWTFRRCEFWSPFQCLFWSAATAAATANADLNILFEACRIFVKSTFQIGTSAGNKAGGIYFVDCDFGTGGSGIFFSTTAGSVSVAAADGDRLGIHLRNCRFFGTTPVSAGTLNHVRDDGYCRFLFCAGSTNFTLAATSRLNPQANVVFSSHAKWGYPNEWVGRNPLGWTPESVAAQYDGGATSTVQDFFATGLVRPWGAGPSIGAIERAEITRDTTTLIDGVDAMKVSGKGDVDFLVPVEAAATVITVKCRQDASYGAGTKPQLLILAEPSIGVAAQTITGVAAVSTNETLTAASFTPTASGVVTVRLRSQAATAGSAAFDSLSRS